MRADQSTPTEDVKNADNAATSKDANRQDEADETNTPRFQTYVNLHNEVRIPFERRGSNFPQ